MEENTRDISKIGLALRGMAMGIAEVIPGVSGGTIAFITGIYETLLSTITSFDLSLIEIFKKEGLTGVWNKINGNFILFLFGGMLVGVVFGIIGVTYLLENYPEPLWAFFFGLILASAVYFLKMAMKDGAVNIAYFLLGLIISYFIVSVAPADGSDNLLYVFLSGALAICALILPGISGSFILLLLGMYTVIIPGMKSLATDFNVNTLLVIIVFAAGCGIGLLLFSRVLNYTFKNYKFETIALMAGFMFGSLKKIWPWRNPTYVMNKETGEEVAISNYIADKNNELYKLIQEDVVMPAAYNGDSLLIVSCLAFLIGIAIVVVLLRKQ